MKKKFSKNTRSIKARTMAFGLGKLAVLESKLDIYEDLSKEMLDKLERAVATISENSNRVAIILERHENRLNESDKNDLAIMKLVEKVEEKIDNLEKRVNDISRFRWITVGIATAAVVIIRSADIFGSLLTPEPKVSMMESTAIHRNALS